jgi:hypothetical protein
MEQQSSTVGPRTSLSALVDKLNDKKLRGIRELRRGAGLTRTAARLNEPLARVKEWYADPVFKEALLRAEVDPEAFAEASAAATERWHLARERADQRDQAAKAKKHREARAAEWWHDGEESANAADEAETEGPSPGPAPSPGATPQPTTVAVKAPADQLAASRTSHEETTVPRSEDVSEPEDLTIKREDSPGASIVMNPGLVVSEVSLRDRSGPGPTQSDATIKAHKDDPDDQKGDDTGSARALEDSGKPSRFPEGNQTIRVAAAGLLLDLGDPSQVEIAMGLPPGTIGAWSGRQAFRDLVALMRSRRSESERADIEFGRLLTPSQRRAAELTVQGKKQAEVARDMGVHRQTIRNWGRNPGFSLYVQQLEGARRSKFQLERQAEEEQQERKLRALEGRCWSALEDGMNAADPKMALAIVGAIQRGRR